jgi:hypothetical protein
VKTKCYYYLQILMLFTKRTDKTITKREDNFECDKENTYEGVSKRFRTGRLERELRMVQLSATRCNCIAIL